MLKIAKYVAVLSKLVIRLTVMMWFFLKLILVEIFHVKIFSLIFYVLLFLQSLFNLVLPSSLNSTPSSFLNPESLAIILF